MHFGARALAIWAVAYLAIAWGALPGPWRRASALLLSLIGLAFLLAAVNSEGLRETKTTAVFLIGTPYVTAQASASASLPYYVLTGLCLLAGAVGLALTDETAHVVRRHWLAATVALSLGVAAVRFLLEKAAAPPSLVQPFGVTWLPPVVGAYFWLRLREEGHGVKALALCLLGYGFAVRAFVAFLYVLATVFRLGSHYDISALVSIWTEWGSHYRFEPGSVHQLVSLALVPQLLVWPLFTVVAGLIGAAVAAGIGGLRPRTPVPLRPPLGAMPAREDS